MQTARPFILMCCFCLQGVLTWRNIKIQISTLAVQSCTARLKCWWILPAHSSTCPAFLMFLQLCQTWQLAPYQSHPDLAMGNHATVISKLDYCNLLYIGLPLIWKLQLIQNVVAWVFMRTSHKEHIQLILHEMYWLTIKPITIWNQCIYRTVSLGISPDELYVLKIWICWWSLTWGKFSCLQLGQGFFLPCS